MRDKDEPGLSGGQLRRRGPGDGMGWAQGRQGGLQFTGLGLRTALSETGAEGEIRAASGSSSNSCYKYPSISMLQCLIKQMLLHSAEFTFFSSF